MDVEFNRVKSRYNWAPEFCLKKEQTTALNCLKSGQHVIAILPTGYGKSMLFVVPAVTGLGISLVISPLRALMEDQATYYREAHGIKTVILKQNISEETLQGVKNCEYQMVFASPETILDEKWLKLLRCSYKDKVGVVAIDEVHCVTQWGTEDFRIKFRELLTLRSYFSNTPWLLLTATLTEMQRCATIEALGFNKETIRTIAVLPDRSNIFLRYVSRPGLDYEQELCDVLQDLKVRGSNADKVIVYCKTISQVTDVFEYLVDELGDAAYVGNRLPQNRIVTMFHGSTDEDSMAHTLQHVAPESDILRCVIATIAFGLGISITNVRHVYIWGIPGSIQSLWQMIGRVARDGQHGEAHIYATKKSMHCTPLPDDETKTFVSHMNDSAGTCVRIAILRKLVTNGMDVTRLDTLTSRKKCDKNCLECVCTFCSCCSLCRKNCPCMVSESVPV